MPLEVNCTTEEKVTGVTYSPTTLSGNPATLDGPPTVTVASGNGTVEDPGGLPGGTLPDLLSGDSPEDVVFLVEGDGDLGAGVVHVSDTITLHVAGAQAKSLGLSGGSVVPK
jgi:hypothetical protein